MADFFDNITKNADNNTSAVINLEKLCVIYLAYFDEARGHQLLLVHPPELKNDLDFLQAESKTIFIHSIWWMAVDVQAELSHVDLEFGGRNYLAKKFLAPSHRMKKRSGLNETTPETIVLILSIPINLNPFGDELIAKLFQAITAKHIDDFSPAIEKTICDAKIIKSPHDKEVSISGEKILQAMTETIHSTLGDFAARLDVTVSTEDEKRKALAYLLYQDIKTKIPSSINAASFFEEKFSPVVLDISALARSKIVLAESVLKKDENKIYITLVNKSNENICDCVVSIAYIEDFFEKYFYDVNVDCWFENEELNFQFEQIGKKLKEEYLISVKQSGELIFQQKIITTRIKVE